MRIFVTGASGFIGGAIAGRLAERHEVRAMSRSAGSDVAIRALAAEPVRCTLEDVDARAIGPCDAVVHAAAYVEPWGRREDYWRANVEGTERVLAAAREAGAGRFVQISTEAVLWRGQHLRDVDESHPYPEHTPILYAETKGEAERRVLAANAPGFAALALRPRLVWGPGDTTLVPEATAMIEKGAFVWLDGGRVRTSTTHVANLVHAVELALERGRGGQTYFVTDGEDAELRDFFTRLLAAHGVQAPDRSLPSWLVRPLAAGIEATWRGLRLRSAPPLTRHAVGLLCCDCTLRIDKAREELGYSPPLAVAEGLKALERAPD